MAAGKGLCYNGPMDKLNRDGNMLGRICALLVLVAVAAGVGKLSGYSLCAMGGASCCSTSR